jgi:SAM-dependent methyltransferase
MERATPNTRVQTYRRMLALRDCYLDKTSKVLDFGCGSGALVYAFRDAGYDAYGFDIHDCLELRAPGDRQHFQIANKGGDTSDFSLDWSQFLLPFEDASFDLVMSAQVLEHVQDHDAVIRELARVTKPGGIGIHIFPPKHMPIEPHTFVPLGGMTRKYWWYRLWAALGIRNEYQSGKTAKHVADINTRYAHTGTKYLSHRELRRIGLRHYEIALFAPQLLQVATGALGWHVMRNVLRARTLFKEIVWVLERPRCHLAE